MTRSAEWRELLAKVRRHWDWGRAQGFARLIEEDELNPFLRSSNRVRRWWWRRGHRITTGTAMPVFLVGAQRSGTNMIVHGLQRCPEFEVFNENHRRAFRSFRLRSPRTIARIVSASRQRYVLFKPLTDTHQVDRLLDGLPVTTHGRALWVYRNVDDRVRSSIAKFGDANLRALVEIASGTGMDRWEAQRLSDRDLELIRHFVARGIDAASASALFWYLRNAFYFRLDLDRRGDVLLVSYDAFVADPEAEMRAVCRFLEFPWRPGVVAHVEQRVGVTTPLLLDPSIRELCDGLTERLETAHRRARASIDVRAGAR